MRILAIIAAALLVALAPPALAKSDKSPDQPPGQSAKADEPDKPAKPDKPDHPAKPDEPGTQGSPPGQVDKGPTRSVPATGGTPLAGPSGQTTARELSQAQRAVEEHEALPLAKIVAAAESHTTGRVIDAKLVRVDGTLLYQLTLLDDAGRSWRQYYIARTGNRVIVR